MKRSSLILLAALMLAWATSSLIAASNPLAKQILKLQPQADKDGDGKLSKAEEAALHKLILKRFPRADSDGDGVLSIKEQQAVMRQATARAKRQGGQKSDAGANQAKGGESTHSCQCKIRRARAERLRHLACRRDEPTPLAIYIHGGGFRAGKEKLKANERDQLLKAGISVAAINYRFMSVNTPLPTPHHDARRALQFMRAKAKEWNIDKDRVAAFGGSAGAQICMWLAYTDDMAKSGSKDPIERESTRLICVATSGGQTTNDIEFWKNKIAILLGPDADAKSLSRPG